MINKSKLAKDLKLGDIILMYNNMEVVYVSSDKCGTSIMVEYIDTKETHTIRVDNDFIFMVKE